MVTVCALLWFVACSSSSRDVQPSPAASSLGTDAVRADAALRASAFPTEALDLLTKSTTDSCSICAEKHRREAFETLDEVYRPGLILTTTAESRFRRPAGGESEITLTSYPRSEPKLTFRFHSAASHLVGIAAADLTDPAVAAIVNSVPEGTDLQGTIQIVAYAYGDGVSYLYSPASNHLQVQCKILEVAED